MCFLFRKIAGSETTNWITRKVIIVCRTVPVSTLDTQNLIRGLGQEIYTYCRSFLYEESTVSGFSLCEFYAFTTAFQITLAAITESCAEALFLNVIIVPRCGSLKKGALPPTSSSAPFRRGTGFLATSHVRWHLLLLHVPIWIRRLFLLTHNESMCSGSVNIFYRSGSMDP
jgi:hypothetical protein